MDRRFVVLITGCNGGVGISLCKLFKRAGYWVIGTDLHGYGVKEFDHYIQCDLLTLTENFATRQKFIREVEIVLKSNQLCFYALINNAAYQVIESLGNLDLKEFHKSQQINVTSPFVLAQLLEKHLREANGCIVNIGSIHARLTKPGFCSYSTSKAALSGLTRALALEFSADVTVNTILPAAIKTNMLLAGFELNPRKYEELEEYHPIGRIAEPDEIAELALFLCSKNARFITGAEIPVDGGIGSRLHDPI